MTSASDWTALAPLPAPDSSHSALLEHTRNTLLSGPTRLPKHVAVTGGTPSALGTAVAFSDAGSKVTLIEADGFDAQRSADLLSRHGKAGPIRITTKRGALRKADTVVDASGLFGATLQMHVAQIEAECTPETLFIILGARPDLDRLGLSFSTPERVISATPVAPPPNMGLVELGFSAPTIARTKEQAKTLFRALGVCPLDLPHPVSEHLIARIEDTTEALIYDGVTPQDFDAALAEFGFDLPPCAAWDARGLDGAYQRHRREDMTDTRRFPLPILDRMVPEGRLGRKAGVGWYRYPGNEGRVEDPLVEDLVREEAHFHRHEQPGHTQDLLRRLTLLSLIDVAAELLAEGTDPALIDLVSITALGFPAQHGGLAHFAARYGWGNARDDLLALAPHFGSRWRPGDALADQP